MNSPWPWDNEKSWHIYQEVDPATGYPRRPPNQVVIDEPVHETFPQNSDWDPRYYPAQMIFPTPSYIELNPPNNPYNPFNPLTNYQFWDDIQLPQMSPGPTTPTPPPQPPSIQHSDPAIWVEYAFG